MKVRSKVWILPWVGAAALALLAAPRSRADAPAGHYTDLGDGTVRDNRTGLIWQQVPSIATLPHAEALGHCAALSLGGSSDWRVPSMKELQTLIDRGRSDPSVDQQFFAEMPAPTAFWTSSLRAGDSEQAWYVTTWGTTGVEYVINTTHVRCVR